MKDYYKILNLKPSTGNAEIKKRYRELAVLYHPDKNQGSKQYEEKFKLINEAYETLSDIEKRKIYDQSYLRAFQQTSSKTKKPNNIEMVIELFGNLFSRVIGIIIMIFIIYLIGVFSSSEEQSDDRPKSGEVKFEKDLDIKQEESLQKDTLITPSTGELKF